MTAIAIVLFLTGLIPMACMVGQRSRLKDFIWGLGFLLIISGAVLIGIEIFSAS